jgi:hypothetical protein
MDAATDTTALADLIAAEDDYQAARAVLAEAEERRYAALWTAAGSVDLPTLKAASPPTITRATIRAAARRFASAVSNFIQPELW